MNQNTQLNKAIDDGDTGLIKSIIIGCANQSAEKAKEALAIVNSRKVDIFVPHKELSCAINLDSSFWNTMYFHRVTRDLMYNFSKERCDHMLNVRQHLDREKAIREDKSRSRRTVAMIVAGAAVAALCLAICSRSDEDKHEYEENNKQTMNYKVEASPSSSIVVQNSNNEDNNEEHEGNREIASTAVEQNKLSGRSDD